ncbi:MAG: DUF424 domain-containing protein [Nanoarchaeota archaeon]|nr:DUF424 domain-containing protein [Nanoarchaeota archaeon]
MLIKVHKAYRDVVAVCDSELTNKKFEQGIAQLDIRENFYKGEEKTAEELIEILKDMAKEDATFNIVGSDSVNCALKAGIISEEGIKQVQDVPFALVLL